MSKSKWYARPRRRPGKSPLHPIERADHGEHPYELIIEIAAKLAVKGTDDRDAVAQAFLLLDKCRHASKGFPYSWVPIAHASALFLENGCIDAAVQRAIALAELQEREAADRHSQRVRKSLGLSLRSLAQPSVSAVENAKVITDDERADRAVPKLREFLKALARGDVPDEINLAQAWIIRPGSDPMDLYPALVEKVKRGEIPHTTVLWLKSKFAIYWKWTKCWKTTVSGRLRHKNSR